ncbi:MAG: hypothetical protein EZS28_000697 [Streblomastix strix]|uniref:Right handed beta helix domain-containing protein n=1 Tax=Streblomastix strix TaxID=222440 RepID=A0A5J4XAE9_9EUKA|nr:MAG: hypothetical protein EZS28_000697 [Streblomastix strix]
MQYYEFKVWSACEAGYGAGILMDINDESEIILNKITFDTCIADGDGGGLYTKFVGNGTLTMTGVNLFKNCSSTNYAGGFCISPLNPDYTIQIDGDIQFDNCSSVQQGGAVLFRCRQIGQFYANKITVKDCNSNIGGGLFIDISVKATIVINQLSIQGCTAVDGGDSSFISISIPAPYPASHALNQTSDKLAYPLAFICKYIAPPYFEFNSTRCKFQIQE